MTFGTYKSFGRSRSRKSPLVLINQTGGGGGFSEGSPPTLFQGYYPEFVEHFQAKFQIDSYLEYIGNSPWTWEVYASCNSWSNDPIGFTIYDDNTGNYSSLAISKKDNFPYNLGVANTELAVGYGDPNIGSYYYKYYSKNDPNLTTSLSHYCVQRTGSLGLDFYVNGILLTPNHYLSLNTVQSMKYATGGRLYIGYNSTTNSVNRVKILSFRFSAGNLYSGNFSGSLPNYDWS